MKEILNITPDFLGYKNHPLDENGKIILPTNDDGIILIYRKHTIDYGNGLIGLLDGSSISVEQWEQLRRCFIIIENDGTQKFHWSIGGSDSGAVLGISPYSNPREVYDEKHKKIRTKEIDNNLSFTFEYGHINEELLAKGFQARTNLTVVKDSTVFFNEKIGFLQANVDYFVKHPDGMFSILEIKTTNAQNTQTIEDYKKGRVPLYYYSQAVLHYPLVLGEVFNLKGTYFAIGYNNRLNDILFCYFNRDKEQEKLWLDAATEFHNHLVTGTIPKVQMLNSSMLMEHLNNLYPKAEPEKKVGLSPLAIKAVENYKKLSVELAESERLCKLIEENMAQYKAIILNEMKDAELSEDFTIGDEHLYCSYKNQRKPGVNSTILKNKYPEIYEECKTISEFRVFRIGKAKKKKVKV